jgi:phosphate transport system permease protein
MVNGVAVGAIRLVVAALVLLLVWIIAYLLMKGAGELFRFGFYTNAPNIAGPGSGVGPQLFNTLYILVLSLAIAGPIGLAAGIYFAEYAGQGRFVNLIRRATETLATLPSIVVGLFGYALFVQAFNAHPSRLAAALALVVINLPYAVRVSEDAMRQLPPNLREASLALGASRFQTIVRAMIPAATAVLMTGVILMSGRVFGEAAAILFTGSAGAISTNGDYSLNPFAQGDSLAVDLYVFRIQADPATVPDASQYADGVAALLIVAVLFFNFGARAIGHRLVARMQGLT